MFERQFQRHGLESFLSALEQIGDGITGVNIQILPQLGHINLRGNPKSSYFLSAVEAVLEQALPVSANTLTTKRHRVFWLGPDEWLIVTPDSNSSGLTAQLREALSAEHASVTEVTGGQVSMRLTGPNIREVLSKGCTLDFHPDVFKENMCAQSGLAKANVLIAVVDDQSAYEIVVRRSFSEYLARWLQYSATEYGVNFSVA